MIPPTGLILVCGLPGPRDLEIARLLGWYRIPLRTTPKVVAVNAQAFYQPDVFGESGGQIESIAPARSMIWWSGAMNARCAEITQRASGKRTAL